jgi:hypothetical protein
MLLHRLQDGDERVGRAPAAGNGLVGKREIKGAHGFFAIDNRNDRNADFMIFDSLVGYHIPQASLKHRNADLSPPSVIEYAYP